MSQTLRPLGAMLLLAPVAAATDLDLSVESSGSNHIVVGPGQSVSYSVVGVLSDDNNEGLALFLFDLSFDGGDLSQADAPTTTNMQNFATPLGMSNPAGMNGTVVSGDLVQIGGGQNTINNTFAAVPTGSVITGIANTLAPETLITGSLTAPDKAGVYTLSVSNVIANVIQQGETGSPIWRTERAPAGTVTDLTVEVRTFTGDISQMSLAAGGTQTLSLDSGASAANRFYIVLGSLTGTSPGIPLGPGLELPTVFDAYWSLTLTQPNQPPLGNSFNLLDGSGQNTMTFTLPPGTNPALSGFTFYHAYVLLDPIDCTSNAVSLLMLP